MNVIKVLTLLFIFASCNLFKSKDESLINHKLDEQENFDITIVHQKSRSIFVKKGRKILHRGEQTFPVNYEKFEKWYSEIEDVYFDKKVDKQPKTTNDQSSFRLNTELETIQVFFVPLAGQPDKNFVRVRTTEKSSRRSKTRMGIIDKSDLEEFLINPQDLRKNQYFLPPSFSQGFYYVNEKEYQLTANELKKISSLFSNFKADNYSFSGKVTDSVAKSLKLGSSENDGLRGVFFLESNNSVYVFYTYRPATDRLRLWVRGDYEVLEGPFDSWQELKDMESRVLAL